jgi:outer membrane protein OmpA-like peptidoglycan-associated protein
MKKQTWMVLFVSVVLGASALAQNGASSATSQTSSGLQGTSEREPLQEPRAQNFWDGDDPNLFNLVAHPWANKKYVLRHTLPIKDRLNELDEITAENSVKIKDIDSRSQQALQLASEKVGLADQHATEAVSKAQLAQTAANNASMRVASLERVTGNQAEYKGSAKTEIRFRPGQSLLSKNAKHALDQMAAPLKDQNGYIIEVRGFAPGRGHAAVVSSKKMADSVVRYLVLSQKIPVHRIYVMNLGNPGLKASASNRANRGRVEVSVMQSGLVDTAQR